MVSLRHSRRTASTTLPLGMIPVLGLRIRPALNSLSAWRCSSVVEHPAHTRYVGSSNLPSAIHRPAAAFAATQHAADAVALQAQTDLVTAYNDAKNSPTTSDLTGKDLGGKNLTPGVYSFSSSAQLTGPLTLSGNGVFIFKNASARRQTSDTAGRPDGSTCTRQISRPSTSCSWVTTLVAASTTIESRISSGQVELETDRRHLGRRGVSQAVAAVRVGTWAQVLCAGTSGCRVDVMRTGGQADAWPPWSA